MRDRIHRLLGVLAGVAIDEATALIISPGWLQMVVILRTWWPVANSAPPRPLTSILCMAATRESSTAAFPSPDRQYPVAHSALDTKPPEKSARFMKLCTPSDRIV